MAELDLHGAASPAAEAPAARPAARFTTGPTLRHVVEMTLTGSVGLFAVFAVDVLTLVYIAWLGDEAMTAAIGYGSLVIFLATSVNIGLMIAAGALVSKAVGAGEGALARRLAGSCVLLATLASALVTLLLLAAAGPLLDAIGATGRARDLAMIFLMIALPGNLLMALGMTFSGVLRAVGDARRSMHVTLAGAVVTAALDPVVIYALDLGVVGAAIGLLAARLAFAVVGFHGAVRVHRMVRRPSLREAREDVAPALRIAGPAILTNLATPVAGLFVARLLQPFGEPAIAANAVVDRLAVMAYGVVFALSGAIGPILGQNWGARLYPRMTAALRDSLLFTTVYILIAWAILIAFRAPISALFGLSPAAAAYLEAYCLISGVLWFANGLLFVANAAFNNLGFPVRSTLFNWGKATLGTLPFAAAGAYLHGVTGLYAGMAVGALVFGVAALLVAFRVVNGLAERRG